MRFLFFLIVIGTYIMSGCGPLKNTENLNKVSLPDLGEAPELTNEIWLNTIFPLRLADLRGKVVLI